MILSQVITVSLLHVASATPYYDFLYRLEEFKARALDGGGCDWWRDVLKLHFRHETFCEEGLLDKIHDLDDFEIDSFDSEDCEITFKQPAAAGVDPVKSEAV